MRSATLAERRSEEAGQRPVGATVSKAPHREGEGAAAEERCGSSALEMEAR